MENLNYDELMWLRKCNDLELDSIGKKYNYDVNKEVSKEDKESLIELMAINNLIDKELEKYKIK